MARMYEGIDTVDGRWHPGYEQRDEEQQGDLRIPPSSTIGLHRGSVLAALHRHDAGIRRRGSRRHGRGHDVDGVLLVVRARRGTALAAAFAVFRRIVCLVGHRIRVCELAYDLDVGHLEAVEGVEVVGGIESAQLLTFLK